jgi:hypothetical protein
VTINDIENFSDEVKDVIRSWFKNDGFKDRKVTDTPTDDLQVVNKNYVDTQVSSVLSAIPTDATIAMSDITTNNVSTSLHGWTPKAPNDTTKFLRGDAIWAVPAGAIYASGTDSKQENDVSQAQNIAHGLGVTPKYVRLKVITIKTTSTGFAEYSELVYNGSVRTALSLNDTGTNNYTLGTATNLFLSSVNNSGSNNQTGVVTFTSTNIVITWTKNGTPGSLTWTIFWEAFA